MNITDILNNTPIVQLYVSGIREDKTREKVNRLDIPAQVQFLRELSRLRGSEAEEDKTALAALLDEAAISISVHRVMYTLTTDGKQLRCWWTFPSSFSPYHVDSCGMGDLWTVKGDPEGVRDFMSEYFHQSVLDTPVTLPNGVRIYGFLYRHR